MNLFVLLKLAPDTVEELTLGGDGLSLDQEFLRFKLGDPDEHALEQALLLKEAHGGSVTVAALDVAEVQDALFTALAKGADRAVQLTGADLPLLSGPSAARIYADFLKPEGRRLPPDTLVLLRSQAIDELDGEIAPMVAELLGLPYLGVVTGVRPEGANLIVTKEYAGGLRGEFVTAPPAVLGVQSATRPPRYVPIAKVRAAMKSARIETLEVAAPATRGKAVVRRLFKPETTGRAQMLDGTPETVAESLCRLFAEHGFTTGGNARG